MIKKIITILVSLVLIITLGIFVKYFLFKSAQPEINNVKQLVQDRYAVKTDVYASKTAYTPSGRVQAIIDDIKQTATTTPDLLAFKKTMLYHTMGVSVPNGFTQEKRDSMVQTYNGLYDLGVEVKNYDAKLVAGKEMLNSRILIALHNSYRSSCFIYPWVYESKWVNDPDFEKYQSRYSDKNLSFMLFLESKLKAQTSVYEDKVLLSTRMFNLSQLLMSYESSLSDADKSYLLNELGTMYDKYLLVKPTKMYDISFYTKVFPAQAYAITSQTLYHFKQKNISYDSVDMQFKSVVALVSSEYDKGYIGSFGKYFTNNMYAYFLDSNKMSGYENKVKELYKESYAAIEKSKQKNDGDVKVLKMYLGAADDDIGSWDYFRKSDKELSEKYPELKSIMDTLEIK